jgi:hypothetical protein
MFKANRNQSHWLYLLIWVVGISTGLFPCLSNAETLPKISITPASVNLGPVKVGGVSTPRMLKIKNTGKTDLVINSITLTGTNASEFDLSLANACSAPIVSNDSCELTVAFVPIAPFGKKNANIIISSNDPKKPTLNVKLSGQAPPPKISVVPMAEKFAIVDIGDASAPKTISIKNTGASDLAINDIGITGSNASEFSQTNSCTIIPRGDSCVINVTFAPELPASKKMASLSISCNDPKNPVVNVKLSGDGSGGTGYSGKATAANINSDNANKIFLFVWGGGSSSQPTPVLTNTERIRSSPESTYMTINSPSIKSIRHISFQFQKILEAVNKGYLLTSPLISKKLNKTLNGSISGSVTYTGTIKSNLTGVLSIAYSNYNNGDGTTIDGSVVLTINSYDKTNNIIASSDMTVRKLIFSSTENSLSMNGSIHMENDINTMTNTKIINVYGQNKYINENFRLANFIVKQKYDKWYLPTVCTEMTTGRVYIESEGYVDIQQVNPFVYNHFGRFNVDVPDSGGSWIFSGASGSSEKIMPLSISQVLIEVDTDGDGFFEFRNTYLWSKLVGVVYTFERVLENAHFVVGNSVQATSDGGYIIAGNTSYGDSTGLHVDLLLLKTNAVGEVEWEKTFGSDKNDEFGRAVLETSDGEFIVAGYSSPAPSVGNVYVVKTDADGNLIWDKIFTRPPGEWGAFTSSSGYSLVESNDGSFVIAGFGGPWLQNAYLLKMTSDGDVTWEQTFGIVDNQASYSHKATPDNGYIMAGGMYIIKTDDKGNLEWQKDIDQRYYSSSIDITSDGGYIVAIVYGADGEIAKLGATGDMLWEKTLDISPSSVIESEDGGFVVTGQGRYNLSCFMIKTDNNGEIQWQKIFDGIKHTRQTSGHEIQKALDGGFIIVGSADGETGNNSIPKGIYIIKTDQNGNI